MKGNEKKCIFYPLKRCEYTQLYEFPKPSPLFKNETKDRPSIAALIISYPHNMVMLYSDMYIFSSTVVNCERNCLQHPSRILDARKKSTNLKNIGSESQIWRNDLSEIVRRLI